LIVNHKFTSQRRCHSCDCRASGRQTHAIDPPPCILRRGRAAQNPASATFNQTGVTSSAALLNHQRQCHLHFAPFEAGFFTVLLAGNSVLARTLAPENKRFFLDRTPVFHYRQQVFWSNHFPSEPI